jgi:hypothetical protein
MTLNEKLSSEGLFLKSHLGAGIVAQVSSKCLASTGPEFRHQYCQNKNESLGDMAQVVEGLQAPELKPQDHQNENEALGLKNYASGAGCSCVVEYMLSIYEVQV